MRDRWARLLLLWTFAQERIPRPRNPKPSTTPDDEDVRSFNFTCSCCGEERLGRGSRHGTSLDQVASFEAKEEVKKTKKNTGLIRSAKGGSKMKNTEEVKRSSGGRNQQFRISTS